MLLRGGGDIPDARRQLALSSLVGGVTGAVTGTPLLVPVMFRCSSLSGPAGGTATGPVHTHGAGLLPVQYWQTPLLLTGGEMKSEL